METIVLWTEIFLSLIHCEISARCDRSGTGMSIGLRQRLPSGRRNFTLGRELGHFLVPTHRLRRERFDCAKSDINRVHSNWDNTPPLERIEIEANEFSATLMVPGPEFKEDRRKLGKGSDVTHIKALAGKFDVSQEMMATIYVRMADEKIAIVTSQNGRVRRVIVPGKAFPYLGLAKDMPIPDASLTHHFIRDAMIGASSDLREVQTHSWLENQGQVTALYEQVLVQKKGWATTLLMIDQDDPDDEEDDRNWNRRNSAFQ